MLIGFKAVPCILTFNYMDVTRVFQGYYLGIRGALQGFYRVIQRCYSGVTWMLG